MDDSATFCRHYRVAVDHGRHMRFYLMQQSKIDTRCVLTAEGTMQFTAPQCGHHRHMKDGDARVCAELKYIVPYTTQAITLSFADHVVFDVNAPCINVYLKDVYNCRLVDWRPFMLTAVCRWAPSVFEQHDSFEVKSTFYTDECCMLCGEHSAQHHCTCKDMDCLAIVRAYCTASYLLWCLADTGQLCADVRHHIHHLAALIWSRMYDLF